MASRTQLFEEYKPYAKMTEFAGYDLPLLFDSIISEHLAVRNSAGFFDVSHMGRFLVEGRDAQAFLNKIVTVDVGSMAAPVVPITLAMTLPNSSMPVLRHGVPLRSPETWMPPVTM